MPISAAFLTRKVCASSLSFETVGNNSSRSSSNVPIEHKLVPSPLSSSNDTESSRSPLSSSLCHTNKDDAVEEPKSIKVACSMPYSITSRNISFPGYYTGEINKDGVPHGVGTWVTCHDTSLRVEGEWFYGGYHLTLSNLDEIVNVLKAIDANKVDHNKSPPRKKKKERGRSRTRRENCRATA